MKEPTWLVRVVDCYSNKTDDLVAEHRLPPIDLSELQRLWNVAADEPMLDCWPIQRKHARFLRGLLGIEFDLKNYSYFLSSFTTDFEASKREGGFMGRFPPPQTFPGIPGLRRVMPKNPE